MGSGVRRAALAFFDVQVARWWQLDKEGEYLALLGPRRRQPALLESGSAQGSDDMKEYLRGKLRISDHFMILKDCY